MNSPSIDDPLELPASVIQNSSNLPEGVKAMLAKRYHIIRELIHVEKEYVKAMSILVNVSARLIAQRNKSRTR
ncbi:hypothetical protein Ciccas_008865 [Cichlidogyrus casuarinus]|uniref:DH domain-containing protein n=1 Tax=Cichlidogyrus casuarinus TaxID=1844966 RepID=A0ABD2PYN7_9PLAT